MSNLIVFNGGIFNSTISCIVYTKQGIEEIYEKMNNLFYCYKLALKKSTGESQLNKSSININKVNIKIEEDDFEEIMDNVLHNYYKVDELKEEGITNFSSNKDNEKLGYKKIQDFNCWFIAMSVGPLKKIITELLKTKDIKIKFETYPKKETTKSTKAKKPTIKSTSSKIIKIEDDDEDNDEDNEKPMVKPKQMKTRKPKEIKKVENFESDDDDNGIIRPIVKPKRSKSSRSYSKSSSRSKEERIKTNIMVKKTTSTETDSDDDIQETIIKKKEEKPKQIKKSKISQEYPIDDDDENIDIDVLSDVYTEDIPEVKDSESGSESGHGLSDVDTDDCWEEIEEPEPGEKKYHNYKTDVWTDDESKTFPKEK